MKGRLQGMEQATREIVRGVGSHYEVEGQIPECAAYSRPQTTDVDVLSLAPTFRTGWSASGGAPSWRKASRRM